MLDNEITGKTRFESWDELFVRMARLVALKSKDPSTQTGCVIMRDMRVLSVGYNGFPIGVDDDRDRYANRELKLKLIAHCDGNAIFSAARAGISLLGSVMYLTGPPCNECLKMIIQAGIVEVVWPKQNKFWDDPETKARWSESFDICEKILFAESNVSYRVVDVPYDKVEL